MRIMCLTPSTWKVQSDVDEAQSRQRRDCQLNTSFAFSFHFYMFW